MGIAGISWPQLLVVLVIVLLIFGTKRIRNIGSDLGGAIREFRKGVGEDGEESSGNDENSDQPTGKKPEEDGSTTKRES
ncbi:MAG: twin-arginine translocase TatA/TatE family subunit [Gammaproteobacteria bacterium]|jgi:sec-independent protein translocase protein TatA|nr:twin-arginine translocase TatA/TatE family subunit [Gammaproteobacteria bacterium]